MGEQLAIILADSVRLEKSEDDALARANAYARAADEAARHVRGARAKNTRKAYADRWNDWQGWCRSMQSDPLPVYPGDLITYLTRRSMDGWAPSTIRLALAAISLADQRARLTPTDRTPRAVRSDPLVQAWLRGWSREHPRASARKAASVTPAQLEMVLQVAQERPRGVSGSAHVAAYARDRAMLLIGIGAALRVSELVQLETRDVSLRDGRELVIQVRRSKTDPFGHGSARGIVPQGRTLRCPVDAWLTWLRLRGDWDGPAFVAIGRAGELSHTPLCDTAARRIVSRRAKAAGLELVSSHSLRRTFATLAGERRKPIAQVAKQGAWRSLDVLAGYMEQGELFLDNPTSGLLDD